MDIYSHKESAKKGFHSFFGKFNSMAIIQLMPGAKKAGAVRDPPDLLSSEGPKVLSTGLLRGGVPS